MRIVHISGSPGTGKTTLGQSLIGARAIDTDELISDKEGEHIKQLKGEEALRYWSDLFTQRIIECIDKAQHELILFFTGILNHHSPDGSILKFPVPNVRLYFLDLPLPLLLQRFYKRYTKQLSDDAVFWLQVSTNYHVIPSSQEYLRNCAEERAWHLKNGYVVLSRD
jgi:shikimate kinase